MSIVEYIDIHKSIVSRIKTAYPNAVFSTDVEKKIERPSFFVELDNIQASDFMRVAKDTDLTVRIYYFTETIDNNRVELLRMQDSLTELFVEDNLIAVDENIKFEVDELELHVIDKVLHCYFDVRITQDYIKTDDTPVMEELENNI